MSKRFGSHTAVSELSLQIPRGSIYGLLGPNGSGKTTTIRMMMGILLPDEGAVTLLGGRSDGPLRLRVGYLPEERGVYRKMKVVEQLEFLGEIRGMSRRVARERSLEWLDRLGLGEWTDRKIEDLSKGMQQKVQFVGTVVHGPELLILDEPFSGLDPINQDVLEDIVRELHENGTTVLFSTHLMGQAERLCERVCLISKAKKVLDGDLRDLKRRERSGVVAVDFEGDGAWLRGPEVDSVEGTDTGARILLRDDSDAQAVLRRGVEAGVAINRFELVEPSLHEIFVRHAGTDAAADAGVPHDLRAAGGGR